MTEVLFYHLQGMSLESVLPPLLEKSLERGWRVVVQSTSPERTEALDAHLWTYSDDSFLPHATSRVGDAQDQPIILSTEEGNPNRANVRFLIDNAGLPADCDSYERLVLVFAASYVSLFILLLVQALHGESIAQPSATTLTVICAWLAATLAGASAVSVHRPERAVEVSAF